MGLPNSENPRACLAVISDFISLLALILFHCVESIYRIFVKPPLKSLEGDVILVTGGANGIGREMSLLLAKTGAKIVSWDIDESANNNLVTDLRSKGCDAYGFKVDITERSQVQSAASKVQSTVGDVTILINNAGIMPCKNFFDHKPEELEKIFKVNVFGNMWTIQAFVPKMMSMNKGHVVTLCSAAGLIAVKNLVPYCSSKHAVHGLVEGLKSEFRDMAEPPNIQFTTVYPYSCNTGLLTGIRSNSRFPWLVPEVLYPEDVAAKAVEGIRRNYEHVYVPGFVKYAGNIAKALPPKIQYAAAEFIQCYVEPMK